MGKKHSGLQKGADYRKSNMNLTEQTIKIK